MRNTEWMVEGACRAEEIDKNIFFPEQYDTRTMEMAKAVCARCGVRVECLEYAVEDRNLHGVFGGMSDRGRRILRGEHGKVSAS